MEKITPQTGPKTELSLTKDNNGENEDTQTDKTKDSPQELPIGENGIYWQLRYEKLLNDYNHLHTINQNLEEKLLCCVESYEKQKQELEATIECEKTTLIADVNKLSTKLMDARIKLHDFEEKELIHASECNAPCHRNCSDKSKKFNGTNKDKIAMEYDPNVI